MGKLASLTLTPLAVAVERSGDRADLYSIIKVWHSALQGGLRAAAAVMRLALDYHEVLCELESLAESDLRDLKLRNSDFFGVAWAEAKRRHRARTGQAVRDRV
jgi:hypothetical protein